MMWVGVTCNGPGHAEIRLLNSPSLVAIRLSVGCETWPPIGWHHAFVIGWSKYRLGLPSAPLHYRLTWPLGISPVFQNPLTVPMHSPNGRYLSLGLCKGTSKESMLRWPEIWLLTHPLQCLYASVNWDSIGSDNGLSPDRRQAIIWTNARILLIGPLGTNFNEIRIKIQNLSFMKMHLKMSSGKWRPFCPGGDVLTDWDLNKMAIILQTAFWNAFASIFIQILTEFFS